MADFLTRLAARSLGLTPVVQPAIASIFAPGPIAIGDDSSNSALEPEFPESAVNLEETPLLPLVPQGDRLGATLRLPRNQTPSPGLYHPMPSNPVEPVTLGSPAIAGEGDSESVFTSATPVAQVEAATPVTHSSENRQRVEPLINEVASGQLEDNNQPFEPDRADFQADSVPLGSQEYQSPSETPASSSPQLPPASGTILPQVRAATALPPQLAQSQGTAKDNTPSRVAPRVNEVASGQLEDNNQPFEPDRADFQADSVPLGSQEYQTPSETSASSSPQLPATSGTILPQVRAATALPPQLAQSQVRANDNTPSPVAPLINQVASGQLEDNNQPLEPDRADFQGDSVPLGSQEHQTPSETSASSSPQLPATSGTILPQVRAASALPPHLAQNQVTAKHNTPTPVAPLVNEVASGQLEDKNQPFEPDGANFQADSVLSGSRKHQTPSETPASSFPQPPVASGTILPQVHAATPSPQRIPESQPVPRHGQSDVPEAVESKPSQGKSDRVEDPPKSPFKRGTLSSIVPPFLRGARGDRVMFSTFQTSSDTKLQSNVVDGEGREAGTHTIAERDVSVAGRSAVRREGGAGFSPSPPPSPSSSPSPPSPPASPAIPTNQVRLPQVRAAMPMPHLPMSDRQATGRHSTELDALTKVEISPVALSEGSQSVPRVTSHLGRPTTSLPSQHSTEEASVRVRPLLDGADVEQKSKTTQPSGSDVLQPQTNFESSRAVQPTASTAQPVYRVRPQLSTPTEIYPQRHAQLESGKSMFADRREAASGREAPTPTIEVTIGRIEVRGNSQPEKPKSRSKPAQRGPALSLNDYLKQRQGGKP